MALVFLDNSSFNNFKDILNYYKNLFTEVLNNSDKSNKSNHGANPFLPDKWEVQVNSEYDTITYVYNSGYNYLKTLINTVEATKNGIHKGLRTLFINYDDPEDYWQEDLNYSLINSYAESSRSFQYYNKKTQNFEERPEYFWTRGNYYDMLPMCTAGKYLLAYKSSVENACRILEEYKTLFYNFSCPALNTGSETSEMILTYQMINASYAISYDTESSGMGRDQNMNRQQANAIQFYTMFWNENLATLKSRIENGKGKNISSMLKIGQETQYPEQTNDTNVVYVKKYYSSLWDDLSTGTGGVSAQKITNTNKLSTKCGTYSSSIKLEN